ncbi:MAG: FtsX-like permease family protein [Clostridia bacterium]|nr:FtsX-like permease family protein [Clostridia bacterium]
MGILFRHTLRSVRSNFGQVFVIILTIMLASILLFVTCLLKDIFYNYQLSTNARIAQDNDVEISGTLFSSERLENILENDFNGQVKSIDKYVRMTGLAEFENTDNLGDTIVVIEATDLDYVYNKYGNSLSVVKSVSKDFTSSFEEIWINESFAKSYNLDVGNYVELYIGTEKRTETFVITYIFKNSSIFTNSSTYNVLIDIKNVTVDGLINTAYLKLNDNVNIDNFISSLNEKMDNKDLSIKQAIDYNKIWRVVNNNTSLLDVLIIFIFAIIFFILLTAYNVIVVKRVDELNVFKSVGATPKQNILILLFEGFLYGLVGTVFGILVGRLLITLISEFFIPGLNGIIKPSFLDYFITIIVSITISILATLLPSIRLLKNGIYTREREHVTIKKKINPLFSLIPLAIAILSIFMIIYFSNLTIIFSVILIISIIAFSILFAPSMIQFFSYIISKNKGSHSLAGVTIKRNNNGRTIAILMSAVMAFVFVCISISSVIVTALKPFNERFKSDLVVQTISTDVDMENVNNYISSKYGVNNSDLFKYTELQYSNNEFNYYVVGVKNAHALRNITSLTNEGTHRFNNESSVAIVNNDLLERLKLKMGDNIKINIKDVEYEYEIIGVDYTETSTDRLIYINYNYAEFKFTDSFILLDLSKNIQKKDLFNEIKEGLINDNCYIIENHSWIYGTSIGVGQISTLLNIVIYLIAVISTIGIINIIISYLMSRKKEIKIYVSSGMGRKEYIKMILFEGIIISVVGAILGIVFSFGLNLIVPNLGYLIDRYISLTLFPVYLIYIFVAIMFAFSVIYLVIGARTNRKIFKK